jgi:hypothetical protein
MMRQAKTPKLTQRHIHDLSKQFALKRYGKGNEQMTTKYIDMTTRL